MRRVTGLFMLVFGVGCPPEDKATGAGADTSPSGETGQAVDADGDGWATPEDCDDADASVHPEAEDLCDEIDQDCDGEPDEGQARWFPDQDGDGYGDPDGMILSCEDEVEGYVRRNNEDCDDTDADIHPFTLETCDGVDEDCDGVVDDVVGWLDADGDGYGDPAVEVDFCDETAGGVSNDDDCDDGDAAVSPAAAEIWYDGRDQDCDGASDYDADQDAHDADAYGGDDCDDADPDSRGAEMDEVEVGAGPDCGTLVVAAKLYGQEDEYMGYSVSGGDTDGDGLNDVLVGAFTHEADRTDLGGAVLFLGPVDGERPLTEGDARVTGADPATWTGYLSAIYGDGDEDGYADVSVSADDGSTRTVYTLWGPLSGEIDVDDADASWSLSAAYVGDVLRGGDLTGDGAADLLVGYYMTDFERGGAYILEGDATGERLMGDSTGVIHESGANGCTRAGRAGDTDGDGIGEVLLGCYDYVLMFLGPIDDVRSGDPDASADGVSWGSGEAGGDTNGDGYGDVLIDTADIGAGRELFVVAGPWEGIGNIRTVSDLNIQGDSVGPEAQLAAGDVDLDGDGFSDLLGCGTDRGDLSNYYVTVFYSPLSGVISTSEAAWTVYDAGEGTGFGYYGMSVGDVNGDGLGDVGLTETNPRSDGLSDGLVWVLAGGSV